MRPWVICSAFPGARLRDRQQAHLRIYFYFGAVGNGGGDIHVKSGKHRHVAKCGPLRENWIDRVQDDRQRHDATRLHLMQHPGRRDAALGRVQHQDPADIGLACQLVRGPAEDTLDAVEIVTGGK